MCRVAGKVLYEYGLMHTVPVQIFSMHDAAAGADENKYFPAEMFTGYNASKAKFIADAVAAGSKCKTVILSHINLVMAGWLIKKISPATEIILMAHGIEIWYPLSKRKTMMLKACDRIMAVSSYTCERITKRYEEAGKKCIVLNNCIDPFLKRPGIKKRDEGLMKRYGFNAEDIILFTLTRLSAKDRYKGYDHVLHAIASLSAENANLKYLLAGSCDPEEKKYILGITERLGLQDKVVLAGFVPDNELPAHFALADVYVMPSIKEGFGIVFVEAMFYGLPVIAGNADGSSDALLKGRLGLLIEPEKPEAIADAIMKILNEPDKYKPDNTLLMEHFSYECYKRKLGGVLFNESHCEPELAEGGFDS